jgi:serine/threonine protein kinase
LGDNTLDNMPVKNYNQRVQLEIIFQIVVCIIYLNKAGICHHDLKADNVVLRKNVNKKIVRFKVNGKRYPIQPYYFTYPIDYGLSTLDSGVDTSDFINLTYMLYMIPVFKYFKEFHGAYFTPNSMELKKRYISLLDDEMFDEILLADY